MFCNLFGAEGKVSRSSNVILFKCMPLFYVICFFFSCQDILYIGDHIFGDILKSKKKQGWR